MKKTKKSKKWCIPHFLLIAPVLEDLLIDKLNVLGLVIAHIISSSATAGAVVGRAYQLTQTPCALKVPCGVSL